jgi:hypothetical protein
MDGLDFGESFLDLIHKRRPNGAIGLGATFQRGSERFELRAKVQHYDDVKVQVVAELEIEAPNIGMCSFSRVSTDPLHDPGVYRVWLGDYEREVPLKFRGLWPQIASDRDDELKIGLFVATQWTAAIQQMLAALSHLGPFRAPPARRYRYPGNIPQSVGTNGTLAPALLGADALRKGGKVVRAVGSWYENKLGGWTLDVAPRGETFSLVLRKPGEPEVEINLVDTGTGLGQVLPVIVQRQFEIVTGNRGGLEIAEDPDVHLHPGAHGDLADLYIEAAKRAGARFLIETHSENFVLRLRRRVAEHYRRPGEGLDPSLVRIYWIDGDTRGGSSIKPIDILPDGEVSNWPEGVFAEDFEEVCAIREAQGMETP